MPARISESERERRSLEYADECRQRNIEWGTCFCGCGVPTEISDYSHAGHGYVAGLPRRYVKAHHRRKASVDFLVDENSGCWIWQRATYPSGNVRYGQTYINGAKITAHRAYYEAEYGPTPPGHHIHHLCPNTLCCRPCHLKPVPINVHMGTRSHVKLTADDVRQIRSLIAAGDHSRRQIAGMYGISRNSVDDIVNRRRWSYVF